MSAEGVTAPPRSSRDLRAYARTVTPDELAQLVGAVLVEAVAAGDLDVDPRARVVVTRPGPGGHGDWSTPIALRLAAAAGMPSTHLAELLAERLGSAPGISRVVVSGDGFLDITVSDDPADAVVAAVLAERTAYGRGGDGALVLGPPPTWVQAAVNMPRTLANPVLLVQLAHARLTRLTRLTYHRASSTTVAGTADVPDATDRLVTGPRQGLVGLLADVPGVVDRAVGADDPAVLGRHLERVAAAALAWLQVAPSQEPALAEAARVVLANGLRVLGTAAPEHI